MKTNGAPFQPLAEATDSPVAHIRSRTPAVFRGLAAEWPAVRTWSFPQIAALSPDLPVRLVVGNREKHQTTFTESTLGEYIKLLLQDARPDEDQVYLKEFDLLKKFPELATDLKQDELFPPGSVTSSSVWLGPALARTGLHYDLPDNLAVQIIGRKRFYLARPGTAEAAGALSEKYDSWARLSRLGVLELAAGQPVDSDDFFVVDLDPGDVLYVPARWWHEVVNLSSGMLLSGFFGSKAQLASQAVRVQTRDVLHRLGLVGRAGCTCHATSRPKATAASRS